jgi:GxxExxY protein
MRNSPKRDLLHADLTEVVIGAFYYVYNRLDYGFLESVYAAALTRVLQRTGHHVAREARVVIDFEGEPLAAQRVDMLVDGVLVVELKSTHSLSKEDHRQLASYLRGSKLQVGLLLHFGPTPKFYRMVSTRRGPS